MERKADDENREKLDGEAPPEDGGQVDKDIELYSVASHKSLKSMFFLILCACFTFTMGNQDSMVQRIFSTKYRQP